MFATTRTKRARLWQGDMPIRRQAALSGPAPDAARAPVRRRAWAGILAGGVVATLGLVGCGVPAPGSADSTPAAAPLAGGDADRMCAMAAQISQEQRQKRAAGTAGPEMAHPVAADWAKLAAVAPAEIAPDLHQIADTTQRQADRKAGNEANHAMAPAVEHYRAYVRQHCPQAPKAPQGGG
jgi:hypothetical protein